MAGLAITGAMKSTSTAAMVVLLNLTPLDLLIKAEASSVKYSIWLTVKQTVVRCYGANTATHLKTAKCPYRPY